MLSMKRHAGVEGRFCATAAPENNPQKNQRQKRFLPHKFIHVSYALSTKNLMPETSGAIRQTGAMNR